MKNITKNNWKKFYPVLVLRGDSITEINKTNLIAKIESMAGFVDKKATVKGRKETARMLVSAYNYVFCKRPLPKSISKLIKNED